MKLIILYDDAVTASREDMALKEICKELQQQYPINLLGAFNIDPENSDVEKIIQAITSPKKRKSNGSN